MLIEKYNRLKNKGAVEIVKNKDKISLSFKQFNPETGEEENPLVYQVNFDELEQKKAELQKQIDEINDFIQANKIK